MTFKKVSLIVLNYNGKEHLQECFDSIFRQTQVPDEVILMDNNSKDGSISFMAKNFPTVKIIKNRFNSGTAEGSNIAFRKTSGNYVIFQSNDIRLDRNCVQALVETMDSSPAVGIASSVLLRYDKDKKINRHLIDNAGGVADVYGFGMQKYWGRKIEDIPAQKEIFFSYGGSFIIRRETYALVGGFDDRYFTLGDDIDLSWRVRLLGLKVICNKKSFIYHKVSATLGPLFGKPMKRFWSEKNSMRTLLKNHDALTLIKRFPIYLCLLVGEMGYFLARGRFSLFMADVRAILWNIRYFPETIRLRHKIQKLKAKNNVNKLLIKKSLKIKYFNDFKGGI